MTKKILKGMPSSPTIEVKIKITPKLCKSFHAALLHKKRIKPIKRTRKRQIEKARHMLAFSDHTSYEWSQYWRKPYGKFRRNATRYSKRK